MALRSWLAQHGLNDIETDLWSHFVESVLEAIGSAHSVLRLPAEWKAFSAKAGALGVRKKRGALKGKRIPAEEALSLELSERMVQYLTSAGDAHMLKKLYVMFDCEARLPDKKRTGKRASRSDIRARSGRHRALEFVLEAKVLEGEGQIAGRLLGADGMGCFTRKAPYSEAPVAGLVAYVVENDEAWWLGRLAVALPAKKATRVAQETLHPGRPAVLASVPRAGGRTPLGVVGLAFVFASG
jgi:hypothetical protein